jgi:thiol-disulfide isomerase/thioredoxin
MKRNILLLAVLMTMAATTRAQHAPLSADEILKEAYATAAKENKKVFIIFHASWCGWCHKMDSSMNDASCRKFFDDHFVVRHLVVDESKDKKNLENPGANELRTKYNGDGIGIPFWLIFDKDGNLLADSKIRAAGTGFDAPGDNMGCPASEKEVASFIALIKKMTTLTPAQEKALTARFRKNEN